jgi:hypothetical protein
MRFHVQFTVQTLTHNAQQWVPWLALVIYSLFSLG